MLNSMYYLKDSVTRLRRISQNIEKYTEKNEEDKLNKEYLLNNALNAIADIKGCLSEFSHCIEDNKIPIEFIRIETKLPYTVAALSQDDVSLQLLNTEIKNLIAPLNNFMDYQYESYREYHYSYKNGRYLEERDINHILLNSFLEAIGSMKGLKFLETNASDSTFLRKINEYKSIGCEIYGAFSDSYYVNCEYRNICNKLAIGSLKNITSTHEAFDVIFCNPKIDIVKKNNNLTQRNERDELMRAITLLSPYGVLIFSIPLWSLRMDVATYLSKALDNIQIRIDNNIAYIIGNKNNSLTRVIDENIAKELHQMILYDDKISNQYGLINNLKFDPISIQRSIIPVKFFRGNELDKSEMEYLYSVSPCMKQFFKDQKGKRLTDGNRHPPLPFTTGQLGLILTSGCLDGIVEDKNGFAHVVKGRVVKTENVSENVNDDEITTVTVSANRVELEMFLPDGSYRRLA